MEIWLIWAAVFAGIAFGVMIVLLLRAEAEIQNLNRRLTEVEGTPKTSVESQPPPAADDSTRLSDLEQRLASLNEENEQLRNQLREFRKERIALQEEIHRLENAETSFANIEKEIARLEGEKKDLAEELQKFKGERERSEKRVQEFETTNLRMNELDSQVKGLEEERSRLAGSLESLASEHAAVKEKVLRLEETQNKLPEMERQVVDLLEVLRTIRRASVTNDRTSTG